MVGVFLLTSKNPEWAGRTSGLVDGSCERVLLLSGNQEELVAWGWVYNGSWWLDVPNVGVIYTTGMTPFAMHVTLLLCIGTTVYVFNLHRHSWLA
jgi:hypothetical protein